MRDFSVIEQIERSINKKFKSGIWSKFIKGVKRYKLINSGDKIAVCISGGKDSFLTAKLLQMLQRHSDVPFELEFLSMNPGYNEYNYKKILHNAEVLGIPIKVFKTDIFDVVADMGGSPCYMCARMRRGHLYANAKDLGCNKIALGHHFSDCIETILMGLLYGGQVQTMMPKLHSTNFEGMELIRPMYLVHEDDILAWVKYNNLEFIRCACRFTEMCSSEEESGDGKRAMVKRLIKELMADNKHVEQNIFKSVEKVNLETIIGYKIGGKVTDFLDNYDA
jgi:tRNA(Ile)-lysidine synthase TilS/MesJ